MLDVLNNESLLLEASIDGLEKVMIVNISEKRKTKPNSHHIFRESTMIMRKGESNK
jgi:hypothetical protein